MNYEWIGKTIKKKSYPKYFFKNLVQIKVKLPHVNKKPLSRKRIFVQTPFFHSKIMKMCEQILKKDSAPIQFKLFEL